MYFLVYSKKKSVEWFAYYKMRRRGSHIQFLSFIFVSSGSTTAVDREATWTQRLLCSSVTHSDKLKHKFLSITRHGGSRGITHLILNPRARYWWLVNTTLRSFHLDENLLHQSYSRMGGARGKFERACRRINYFEAS